MLCEVERIIRIHIVSPVVMSTKAASLLCIAICVFASVQSTRSNTFTTHNKQTIFAQNTFLCSVESKSEIVDGYLHVVVDLNELLHNQLV